MRANDLLPDGGQQVDVMPLGFEAADLERLKKIFELAPQGDRRYAVASPVAGGRFDVLLVNYDNPAALQEKNTLLGNAPDVAVVAASRGSLHEAPAYHLRGMLIAARVLSVLDKIPFPSASPALLSSRPSIPFEPVQDIPAPPVEPAPRPQPPPAVISSSAEPEHADGYRALVVDDSVAIQKSLEMNLSALEQIAVIDFADSGEIALEKARAIRYDLIFLDVMMPGIDGYETCSQLRKMPQYKKTPIIMVSGKSSPLDEVKGVIAGCTTYLTKPVQQDAFQKLSRRVLAWLENYQPSSKVPH